MRLQGLITCPLRSVGLSLEVTFWLSLLFCLVFGFMMATLSKQRKTVRLWEAQRFCWHPRHQFCFNPFHTQIFFTAHWTLKILKAIFEFANNLIDLIFLTIPSILKVKGRPEQGLSFHWHYLPNIVFLLSFFKYYNSICRVFAEFYSHMLFTQSIAVITKKTNLNTK